MENRVHELALFKRGIEGQLRGRDPVSLEVPDVRHGDAVAKVIRQAALSRLSTTPYSYRKVGPRSTLRELNHPFRRHRRMLCFGIRSPGFCS